MMPINVFTMCLIILLPNRLDLVFDDHPHAVSMIVAAQQHHLEHYKRGKNIFIFG